MKKNLLTATLMTIVTTIILGVIYPLFVTAASQMLFPARANGSLIRENGEAVGSSLIGQPFTGPGYFHSRPSSAGDAGYDATASGGSNLGPTNQKLIARVQTDVEKLHAENPGSSVPADLVTASASGLDPDISPAAAEFQVPRIARERGLPQERIRGILKQHIAARQFAILGEPGVNVLELNLALDTARK